MALGHSAPVIKVSWATLAKELHTPGDNGWERACTLFLYHREIRSPQSKASGKLSEHRIPRSRPSKAVQYNCVMMVHSPSAIVLRCSL